MSLHNHIHGSASSLVSPLLSCLLLPSSSRANAETKYSLLQVIEQRIRLILRPDKTGEGLLGNATVLELGEHELVVARKEGAMRARGRSADEREGREKGEGTDQEA
jgi:hypothetical protein